MSDRRPELWIVRHGETEWSETGRHTGRTNVPLTNEGRRRASALGERLGGRQFCLVLTSPLARAFETCRLAGYGDAAERSDDLLEWDYGAYEGRTTKEIREEVPGWTVWTHGVPGGETAAQVGARTERVIARALEVTGGDVALFAHGHLLRVLTATWLGLPPEGGRLAALGPASLSVLGYEREQRVIRKWNDDGHCMAQ
jgi:broad specificity phosphatase PhoE